MIVSARSYLAAGVAALTAGVIAIPTTVQPLAAPTTISASVQKERVALLAAAQSFSTPIQPPAGFLVLAPQRAVAPPTTPHSSPGAVIEASPTAAVAAAAPSAQAALVGFPGLESAIINTYTLINPWIDYGVNVAQYAVSWIPVASYFAPQIGIFYYSLIEPIMTSAVYNTAYVLGGTIGLVQGLTNVINDSINAGIGFVNAEINWALSWLPPLPPFPLAATQATALKVAAVAAAEPAAETTEATVADKHDPSTATAVEPTAKPAAETTEPEAAKSPTEPAAEPVTTKPATQPESTKPESTKPETTKPETTSSTGGVSAQGEVRGGTESATDPKQPDAAKPDKGDSASKPAESSPSATKTTDAPKSDDAGKAGDADKGADKTNA